MIPIVKIYLSGGTVVYRQETINAFRSYVNSAHSRGAAVITAYKTNTSGVLSGEVQLNLHSVQYFELA